MFANNDSHTELRENKLWLAFPKQADDASARNPANSLIKR